MSEAKKFGRFEVRRVLGRGGMGTVYEAEDPVIGRTVAIKEIRIEHVVDEAEKAELMERFKLEFRAAGTLSHPNIVTIYDVGQGGGSYFIAMEHVTGNSLAQHLKGYPLLPIEEFADLAQQLAAGLDFAHEHGIIHRDVKPANVLLTPDGRPKITDFGLVKLMSSDLTTTGTVLGTPAFMSPEQVMGKAVDHRTDQFSLAVIFYLMLTGKQPFIADHPSAILYQILHAAPELPHSANSALPAAIDAVLLRGLAKDPEDRYGSCGELAAVLRKALEGGTAAPVAVGNRTIIDPDSATSVIAVRQPGQASSEIENERDDAATIRTQSAGSSGAIDPPLSRHSAGDSRSVAMASKPSSRWPKWLAAGLLAAIAGAASFFVSSDRSAPKEETPSAVQQSENVAATTPAGLQIEPGLAGAAAGAEIWRNGVDTGLRVPAVLPLDPDDAGLDEQELTVELRQQGNVVAQRSWATGDSITSPWQPEVSRTLLVTSLPSGAQVLLDNSDSGQTTPAELQFAAGRSHSLTLKLPGHKSAGWTFTLDDLSQEQRRDGTLHFRLPSAVPPGFLVINASYPVTILANRQRFGPMTEGEIPLPPGRHDVVLVADAVFLRQTYPVSIGSGERDTIRAPRAMPVKITANPANCSVSIGGTLVDVTPINDRMVAVGRHQVEFHWPAQNKKKTVTVVINRPQQRIFASIDD